MKKAIIIGSGIAGMASAIRLKKNGYSVSVFESNSYPGGKLSDFRLNKFRFDAGPPLFTLPNLVDDLFILCGENPSDFFKYKKKEIACNYFWEDGVNLKAFSNQNKFINEVESKLGVHKSIIKKYLDKAKEKYELVENIFLKKSLHDFSTYLTLDTLKALFKISKLEINNSLHDVNLNQLKEKHLVQFYDRYATYNGSDPYKTPGIMSIIQHLESNFGTYVPIKGMNDITQSIYKLAKRQGIEFIFNTKVNEIVKDNKIVKGVIAGGKKYESDIVEDTFITACKEALVDDFVKELPNGYETSAGESGLKLSGGQKQRIAIARAMIKNSPILLLDEATSSLDSEAESKVQIALEALLKEKSALIIAHRLSTIKNADMIYVFDKGKIIEKGNHDELIKVNGLYKALFEMQFPGSGSDKEYS